MEKLTRTRVLHDFYDAYEAKRELIKRQREDFEFRLGKQWEKEDENTLKRKGVLPVTDNRVQSNIFLLTGLERQNRTDIKAYPEGAEDSKEAHIATALIKNVIKQADGDFKFSEAFEDGVTCGEAGLELYLDATYNFLNPTPKLRKYFFDEIYPEPGWKEYDFNDCAYVYKWTRGIKKDDLIALYPEQEKEIEKMESGTISPMMKVDGMDEEHIQYKDYPTDSATYLEHKRDKEFDLLERYYKKWVERVFVVDHVEQSITIVKKENEDDKRTEEAIAKKFVRDMVKENPDFAKRYTVVKRDVPEIWVCAVTGSEEMDDDEFLVNERAWFSPRWNRYPIAGPKTSKPKRS